MSDSDERRGLLLIQTLADKLKSVSSSPEERWSTAEAVVLGQEKESGETAMVESLLEYFDVMTRKEATELVQSAMAQALTGTDSENEAMSHDSDADFDAGEQEDDVDEEIGSDDDDDDGELIGEGECELCERFIQLTQHHLIPRSTWSRLEPRLRHAAQAIKEGDGKRADLLLGDEFHHLVEYLEDSTGRASIRWSLQRTCNVCRPCHNAIHDTYDNMVLATNYNTIDKLLSSERILKFAKWASKQKAGKYAVQSR